MSLVIPDGFYQCSFEHSLTGSLRPAFCTLGVRHDGLNFAADVQQLTLAWAQKVVPVMSDVWHYKNFVCRNQEGTVFESAADVAGGTAHAAATAQVTFNLKKVTQTAGRRGRGRIFLPGVSEQDADPVGIVVPSKITEINNALTAFRDQVIDTAHFSLVILHNERTDGGALPPPAFITSIVCDNMVSTQRRRLRG